MISEPETDTTVNTADTVNTKSICKALKLMRGTKLERESSQDRRQRRKEAARKRKEADEILANKAKLYSVEPTLSLNSIASLKKQAMAKYIEKSIKERNERYGEMITQSTTVSHNTKLGFDQAYIKQIVHEEQHIIDSGIDTKKALAETHREDRERYKSARQKAADKKREEREEKRAFYAKQKADREMRNIHMPINS